MWLCKCVLSLFFNDTATTEIYTLSLHDALPISGLGGDRGAAPPASRSAVVARDRSEEHTSELQSRVDISYAVFCLKKKEELGASGSAPRDISSAGRSAPARRRRRRRSRVCPARCSASGSPRSRLTFFFNDTATTEIYTLSLHDALPICMLEKYGKGTPNDWIERWVLSRVNRSEEHTSELQSRVDISYAVFCLKKKK